ncbi:MAG: RNA polymerase sigma-70 factor (ECF subfamily) [Rhodothermales bacterium]|jgi:RNA polymerase sigma-70 factor (ECF subfamily)
MLQELSPAAPPGDDECDAVHDQLQEFVERYQARLTRYSEQILRDRPDLAGDVVQETFLKLHRALTEKATIANISSWLYRVAHNLAIDVHRRDTRDRRMGEELAAAPPVNEHGSIALSKVESQNLAVSEMQNLPIEQRQVLLLKIIEGMTLQQVADTTGQKISTVHYRLGAGLKALASRLQKKGVVQ